MTYREKLSDPRWNTKRKSILERDGYKCLICKRNDIELQVHHCDYFPNVDPWDYPDDMLYTLCKNHHEEELTRSRFEKGVCTMLRHRGFLVGDLKALEVKGYTDVEYMEILLIILRKMQNG